MADSPQTLAAVILAATYRDKIVKAINRKSVGLSVFPIITSRTGQIRWSIDGDGQVAENFAEGADVANYGSDEQVGASLSWGLYRAPFRVTDLARSVSRLTANPQENAALWAKNIVSGSAKLATSLNAAMYGGAGTGTTIAGLGVAIGDAANTYAGIDRTAKAYWRPTVTDPGSATVITIDQIRDDLRKIYEASGESPDIALVNPTIFNKITALADGNRRYVDTVAGANGDIKLRFGAQAVDVDGCVFVKDKDATAATIFYANTSVVHWEVLPLNPVPDEIVQSVQANDGFGVIPASFDYQTLAKTGASSKGVVTSQIQLVVEQPNACGVRKNVAVA